MTTSESAMQGVEDAAEIDQQKASRKPLLIAVLLAAVLGAGGFYAVWSGMILSSGSDNLKSEEPEDPVASPMPNVVFVPIPPLVVNVGGGGEKRFLRFQAQLEVLRQYEQDVDSLMPRVVDVLNGYLRAVDATEFERKTALVRLRAQMLRRIQIVTGEGRVRDLLIMEFVLN